MGNYKIDISRLGNHFLLIDWPQRMDEKISKDLLTFSAFLQEKYKDLVVDSNPSYASLCIRFNAELITYKELANQVKSDYEQFHNALLNQPNHWRIPVCYDTEFAPDLERLSTEKEITPEELIRLHTASVYRIYFLGFLPGFLYLGGLNPMLAHPRRENPRSRVPKGAIGIGGNQTGIYPHNSPGGWNLIGQTPLSIFEADLFPPTNFNPGDTLEFYRINTTEYQRLKKEFQEQKERSRKEDSVKSTSLLKAIDLRSSSETINDQLQKKYAKKDLVQIEFLTPGLFTTLQDTGRKRFREWGIPQGGFLNRGAARKTSLLFNKQQDHSILEINMLGPKLLFHGKTIVAWLKGSMEVKLDEEIISSVNYLEIQKGQILSIGRVLTGVTAYLITDGEFIESKILNSVSKFPGSSSSMRFEKGDVLSVLPALKKDTQNAHVKFAPAEESELIYCQKGPEFDLLNDQQRKVVFENEFSIASNLTRMAFSLAPQYEALENEYSMLTAPVIPGIIQLTPAGKLIVLMPDAQTTGGYPRILFLSTQSLDQLASKSVGESFRFLLKE